MLEERIIHLLNAEVDGELDAAGREELDAALASSEEARVMQAELKRLDALLADVPEVSPPPGLAASVLGSTAPAAEAAPEPERRPAFSLSGWFSSLQPAPAGLAFAAGLLLAIGFYEMGPGESVTGDTAGMVGTMVTSQPAERTFMKDDLVFSGQGYSGRISLREEAGMKILDFDLESDERTEIDVGLDGTGLVFGGFAQPSSGGDEVLDSVSISGGNLRVVNQGRQQFAVFLRAHRSERPDEAGGMITIGVMREADRQEAGNGYSR